MSHTSPKTRSATECLRRREQMNLVLKEYEAPLLRYAARILHNDDASAQDVVQNVFIKLFKQWKPGTHPSARLKGWLFRVTHNEAVDLIRKESRRRDLHDRQLHEPTQCADAAHCAPSHDERKDLVLSLLNRLHPREQQIVVLRLQQGLSYEEIAGITGRSRGNVGNILHHAVKKLAARVQTLEGRLA